MDNDVGTVLDLSRYRLEKAERTLKVAYNNIETCDYSDANNRIYYSVFYAILAIHALDNKEIKTHKRAIGEFNKFYIHTKIFSGDYGKYINRLETIRHSSDYEDFYEPNEHETKENYDFAANFIGEVKLYCEKKFSEYNAKEQPC